MADQPDTRDTSPERRKSAFAAGLPLGISCGVAIGTALGVASDNLAMGIAMGLAIGIPLAPAFGAGLNKKSKPDPDAKDGSSEETSQ